MKHHETAFQTATQLLSQRDIAFAQTDADLKIETISTSFESILGEFSGQIIGQSITEVMLEFVGAEEALQSVLSGQTQNYKISNVYRESETGGLPTYLSFNAIAADANDREAGLVILVEDSTIQGRLEQDLVQERNELRLARIALSEANDRLRQLDAHKTMFLSMAAHDMRTPLSVIMGYASLLEHASGNAETISEYAELISAQTMWLSRLIGDLLDLDAIERGSLAVKRQPFIFQEVIKTATEAVRPLYQSKELTLTIEQSDEDLLYTGDVDRIQQILFNLLSNARKYTPPKGHVWIRVEKLEDEIVLEVEDTGLGLGEDDLAKLFSPYFRSKRVKNSKITGTGLGLFIAKNLIEQHGGSIEVASEVDKGTIFSVHLPHVAI